ncbi:hypothetical protein PROFUN_16655, partial [Planoprotostelium fungivorum]
MRATIGCTCNASFCWLIQVRFLFLESKGKCSCVSYLEATTGY